jgi:hypothetical protein
MRGKRRGSGKEMLACLTQQKYLRHIDIKLIRGTEVLVHNTAIEAGKGSEPQQMVEECGA